MSHLARTLLVLLTALFPLAVGAGAATAAPDGVAEDVGTTLIGDTPSGTWPLSPAPPVVQPFAPPEVRWGSGHRGVDLEGRVGQPVRAAMAGRVSFSGRVAGVAVVTVDHGATRTTYQPVTAAVDRGGEVAAGTVIGRLEWFGSHCLPRSCLHWGWVRGEEYLDPLLLVGGGPRPVRLLPPDVGAPSSPGRTAQLSALPAPARVGRHLLLRGYLP